MVGRNFWVIEEGESWEVRQEGLPGKTSRHSSREEAWEVANAGARACHGEAFLSDGDGGYSEHQSHRTLPRKAGI
jgi:hypothetical protein